MYKYCALILCLSMLVTGVCAVKAAEVDLDQELSGEVFDMTLTELMVEKEADNVDEIYHFGEVLQDISSPKRMVEYDVLVNEDAVFLDEESTEILCRIVEAEAGNEDEKGRMLIANVVMNRVESSRFPNTVKGVVFQKGGGVYQFSPVARSTSVGFSSLPSVNKEKSSSMSTSAAWSGEALAGPFEGGAQGVTLTCAEACIAMTTAMHRSINLLMLFIF